jgi:hypothetical protein
VCARARPQVPERIQMVFGKRKKIEHFVEVVQKKKNSVANTKVRAIFLASHLEKRAILIV